MKKKLVITVSVVLCLCVAGGGAMYFAPYQAAVKPAAGVVTEKITAYGLSTSLEGADCYLDRLAELKADGITHIEICLREDYDSQAALFAQAVKQIEAQGLKVWSVHLPFGESVDPSEPEETKRNANMEKLKKFVTLTQGCGADTYVIHGSFEPIETTNRTQKLNAAIQSLTEMNAYMKDQNLRLALENLPRTCIGNSVDEMRTIARAIPDLALCFDTNHFTPAQPDMKFLGLQRLFPSLRDQMNSVQDDPVAFAQEFADRIITVHMSDYDGVNECHWFPGQGIVDFQGIHTALTAAGFQAPTVFEPNERCKGLRTTGKRLIDGYEKAIGLQ